MKVRTALRKICGQCKHVKRGRKNFVVCSANPRHKQRQAFSTLAEGAYALPLSLSSSPSSSPLSSFPTASTSWLAPSPLSSAPARPAALASSYASLLGIQSLTPSTDDEDV